MTLSIMALALAALTGCTADGNNWFSQKNVDKGNIVKTDGEYVSREFNIKDFTGLNFGYNTEVTFIQSDSYKVEVKTTEKVFDYLQVKNKNGFLTMEFPLSTPNKVKNEKVYLYVTAPVINNFDLSGVTKLHAEGFKANKVDMDISGASEITVGKVECTQADIDCSGASKMNLAIQAQELDIDCSGASKMKANLQAKEVDLDLSGAVKGELDIVSDEVECDISGVSKISGSFKGKRIDIECSGSGKIDLDVDCENLKAENSGVAKVKISGTADNAKINSSGVSKIDASQLNQL